MSLIPAALTKLSALFRLYVRSFCHNQGRDKGRAVTEEVLTTFVEASAELSDIVSVTD
jgi:hypothetical protein